MQKPELEKGLKQMQKPKEKGMVSSGTKKKEKMEEATDLVSLYRYVHDVSKTGFSSSFSSPLPFLSFTSE
jgi:hypothetical protein